MLNSIVSFLVGVVVTLILEAVFAHDAFHQLVVIVAKALGATQ